MLNPALYFEKSLGIADLLEVPRGGERKSGWADLNRRPLAPQALQVMITAFSSFTLMRRNIGLCAVFVNTGSYRRLWALPESWYPSWYPGGSRVARAAK